MSVVKELALANHLPVFQPASLKPESEAESLRQLAPDLMVVVAYGLLLPESFLTTPTHGCINVHGSILPRWRGAAPIQRAVLAGDATTGVTIMQMDKGLDTGDMLAIHRCQIKDTDSSATLQTKLASMGAAALLDVIDAIAAGALHPQKQEEALATYAHKINKAEAEIGWNLPAKEIVAKIRAFNPWPVAQTQFNSEVLRIWMAEADGRSTSATAGSIFQRDAEHFWVATGAGSVRVSCIQMPGKKPTSVRDFLNAHEAMGVTLGPSGGSIN